MKFEKLNKSKDGKIIFIAGFIMAIILIIIINFFFTKAKYQVTSNIQIVKGKVSYNLADLNVLALQVQESENSETYKSTDEVPSGDYEVNKDKSYCTIGSNTNQLKDIPMEYKAGKVSISITKKGTKCYVFLDFKKTPSKVILANSPTQGDIGDITGPSCSGSLNSTCYSVSDDGKRNNMAQNGVFDTIDDYGKTYVFRGFVQNNWVKFGKKDSDDIWWRIIRVNGNGTLRLIYAGTGTTAPATDTSVTQTTTKAFNNDYQDNRYVGFMYGNSNNTYESTHKNETKSTIMGELESWWDLTTLGTLISKIDVDTGFCNDRSLSPVDHDTFKGVSGEEAGYNKKQTAYAGFHITHNNGTSWDTTEQEPTLKCANSTRDLFTGPRATPGGIQGTNKKIEGNGKLTYPVGLITADEVIYAGGFAGQNNDGYWLYTNQDYWTMSPSCFDNYNSANVFFVKNNGFLHYSNVVGTYGVRPVINLKANVSITGSGTTSDPYIVQ